MASQASKGTASSLELRLPAASDGDGGIAVQAQLQRDAA